MIAVVKYNAGNIFSVQCALNRIGVESILTDDKEILRNADKVIFPGVGEASTAMSYLRDKGLDHVIKNLNQPVLGICIGLQLMCSHTEEGNTTGMGIFDTQVKRFKITDNSALKIPHMGWNTINLDNDILLPKQYDGNYVYYVHSYYAEICKHTIANTEYGIPFSAILNKNNFFATQFHPEKSGSFGEVILKHFIDL